MNKNLIGKQVNAHTANAQFSGRIIDETKHTITISSTKDVIIPKQTTTLTIDNIIIKGADIVKSPIERIKVFT